MLYEVENKFRISDLEVIQGKLADLGATFGETIDQVDFYFGHPVRDFAQTDEALRIRCIGTTNLITYKGPKIDRATKTRRELEVPLAPGPVQREQYQELLVALGFRPVAEVRKQRRPGHCPWQGRTVEIALDQVQQLGPFVELEIGTPSEGLTQAQSQLVALASRLGLADPERRSYLEMLLDEPPQRASDHCPVNA